MTKTIATKNGYTVELKEFITGAEQRYIKDAFLDEAEKGEDGTYKINSKNVHLADDRALQTIIISIDGPNVDKTLPIEKQALNMRNEDFQEVVTAINEITGDKKKEESTEKI